MIFLDINGRCGNQMFQYAFARKLMILNNISDLHIDFFHVERWKNKTGGDITYSDQLQFFQTIDYTADITNGNSIKRYGTLKQKRLTKKYPYIRKLSRHLRPMKLLEKYQNKLHINGIYKEDELPIKISKSKTKDIFINGYFENPNYFDDIKDILFNEFVPKNHRKEKNKDIYSIIDNEESVCVSFRVWHGLSSDEIRKRDVCTPEYYTKAIEVMHSLFPNSHFVIFSNDIDWVKNNINFKYPVVFESGNDEIWEKLRMMCSCKHFIMSTSTFCWWAQYLSKNKNKVVISPSKWYADNSNSYLLMKEWIKIDV